MGFWDRAKAELIDIIEFLDETNDTLVHKYERYNNEIKYGAKLVVRESQVAVFVNEGKIADIFQPGTYTLETKNLPVLSTLMGWMHGFESPFKADVYFVNTKTFTGQKWGTQNPIPLRDPDFGVVRLRAFGTFNMAVDDPGKLVTGISGTNSTFTLDGIKDQSRSLVISYFTDSLGELNVPALDLAANYTELGQDIEPKINEKMVEMGLKISQFLIGNISLPPEVEEAMDKRAQMGVLGNMNQYAQFQAANAMEDIAQNPGGGGQMGDMMNAGMGMAMGVGMANQVSGSMAGGQQQQQQQPSAAPPPLPGQSSYHIAIKGQQYGPYNMDQLKQMIGTGQFKATTMVWKQGMPGWAKAGEQPELQPLFGSSAPPPPPPPAE